MYRSYFEINLQRLKIIIKKSNLFLIYHKQEQRFRYYKSLRNAQWVYRDFHASHIINMQILSK